MATFTLRRFAHPAALKSIRPENLVALLGRHAGYFDRRGVHLAPDGGSTLDYEGIANVLMTPDEATPKGLVDDLYFVHEMATPEAMDELVAEIGKMPEADREKFDLGDSPTPADVAVQARLHAPDLLERKHAEHFLTSRRSFQYFQMKPGAERTFRAPSSKKLRTLEAALDDRFAELKRGRSSRVFVFPKDDGTWFLVRHGEVCKREGSIEESGSSSVYFRPERYDVLKYDAELGELAINPESRKIGDLYREKLGLHLFGDALCFPGTAKYTLEPLRTDGEDALVCSDVDGIEWIRLKEIHFFWGGPEGEVEVRKASDFFAALKRRGGKLPAKARMIRAGFLVKFTDSKTPRTVAIRPSNIASYTRDGDAVVLEEWMRKRGFSKVADMDHAGAEAVLAGA